MKKYRRINKVYQGSRVVEGAGVHLRRIFGFHETPTFDPFLLLDDFSSDDPEKYVRGFPWHPHRGIETITYIIRGRVSHGDSIGNSGTIGAGDIQWMTAGSGIIHQEMPEGDEEGVLRGLQLWANLPASHKMMRPRYQELSSDMFPVTDYGSGITVRVIAGDCRGVTGPVKDIITAPSFLDITLEEGKAADFPLTERHSAFLYVLDGIAGVGDSGEQVPAGSCALLSSGETLSLQAMQEDTRVVLVAGKPLNEPIAWRGPIVMNTSEELDLAFSELHQNRFIKSH